MATDNSRVRTLEQALIDEWEHIIKEQEKIISRLRGLLSESKARIVHLEEILWEYKIDDS